jgi:hydrogenase/urease accessory protein HupE
VVARLVFSRAELDGIVPGLGRADLDKKIVARVAVTSAGAPCAPALVDAGDVDNDGVAIKARWTCGAPPSAVSVDLASVLEDLPSGHRHVVRAATSPVMDAICHRHAPSFSFAVGARPGPEASRSPAPSAWGFFAMGVEHISTGYDHLVFLFGLILVGGRLRSIVATITAFTLAHSVTLGLAALGVLSPSARVVEPLIALSIAYVGAENFWASSAQPVQGGERHAAFLQTAERRWRITFPFGLVHGFGFAGALREIDLPRAKVPMALLTFNLGVEAGQLAVMAIVLPLVLRLRKSEAFADRGVKVLSGGVLLAGLVWFVQRVFWP